MRLETGNMVSERPLSRLRTAGRQALLFSAILFALCFLAATDSRAGKSRIKDIARVAGLERVELVGYGLVVGLDGTGDKDLELTKQTVANLMKTFNISIPVDKLKSKNVATVAVTASARPFHKEGDRVDLNVASLGDAKSLEGGTLLMTPLLNPNGELYALAQGSLTVGGFSAGTGGAGGMTQTKNHTTTGVIPGGAILKESQSVDYHKNGLMRLLLRHPDFTTAERMASVINEEFRGLAVARDAGTVVVKIPEENLDVGRTAAFIASIEGLAVTPDMTAKVIINERTGTIVMGGAVHIGEAVVAHGNLTVTVKETLHPSQPSNLILGKGAAPGIKSLETPDVTTTAEEEDARIMIMPETTTIRELADTLNLMGATPRDLISILQALHRLGAIQMELETM